MKYIITLLSILFAPIANAAEIMEGPYSTSPYSIYDGDTFKAHVHIWLGQTVSMSIRIDGIDTPEIRTKCSYEKDLAFKAKVALEELLNEGHIQLWNVRYGKWAGRVIATVTVDGVNVSDTLIKEGFARPYDGGKRQSWCDQQASISPK